MKIQLVPFFRNCIQCRNVWIFVVFIHLPGSVTGQTINQPAVQNTIQSQADQAVVDEINSIRKQLGGGIEEQLQGLHFGNPLKEQLKHDFDQELKRQLVDAKATKRESSAEPTALNRGGSVESEITPPSGFLASRTSSDRPPVSPVRPLRSAARRLDEIAAELEEAGLYEEADSARGQAGRFWLKARQLQNRAQSTNPPRNR